MIRRISNEEFERMSLHGQGRSSAAYNAILSLQVNQAIIIEKKDWKPKYPPTQIVNNIERKFKMKFIRGALPDRSGWAIKRVR